jgi:hypothetical protein
VVFVASFSEVFGSFGVHDPPLPHVLPNEERSEGDKHKLSQPMKVRRSFLIFGGINGRTH